MNNFPQVVAAEMIQELNLTLPPDQLALLIQQHVASVLNSLETQPLSSPQQREVALPEKSLPPPSDATLKLEQIPSSPSSSVDALHHPLSHEVRQEPEPQQFGEFSPSQENPDFSNLDLYSHSDDSPNYSVVQVDSGSGQEEIQTTSKLSDKVEDLAPLDSNRSDDQSAIPRPDSDATPEELADFAELLREIEKIDKDCRAARRVFEQRIQKHKIIQV